MGICAGGRCVCWTAARVNVRMCTYVPEHGSTAQAAGCVRARTSRTFTQRTYLCCAPADPEGEGGVCELLPRLLCIIPNKQLITRVLNRGERWKLIPAIVPSVSFPIRLQGRGDEEGRLLRRGGGGGGGEKKSM